MSEQKWFRMQDGPPLPWEVGIAIYRGLYEKLFGSQSAETIHERGGGGYEEIKHLANDYYKRFGPKAASESAPGEEK